MGSLHLKNELLFKSNIMEKFSRDKIEKEMVDFHSDIEKIRNISIEIDPWAYEQEPSSPVRDEAG